MAHTVQSKRRSKFPTALQRQKDKHKLLQDEQDRIIKSNNEISLRYEADVIDLRQQANTI